MSGSEYDVVVVGGGPAGSSAAAHLALGGLRVVLFEKSTMPRDKLCGEFLSPEVSVMCRRLGVADTLVRCGARTVTRLLLTDAAGGIYCDNLPNTAHAMSRRAFDHLLFERAVTVGVDARDGEAVLAIEGSLPKGFSVRTASGSIRGRVVIGAYGRRTVLDRRLERPFLDRRSPFVGFKARFEGPSPAERIELHTFPGGYCGLVADEDDLVNVCWLARADVLKAAGGSPDAMIERELCTNPHLHRRFEPMAQKGKFMAVGQLSFRAKGTFASDVCLIGDAAGMIAPLCGDGMGMALRSAELIAPLVERFISGHLAADALRDGYSKQWRAEFSTRMRIGRWLNRILTRPSPSRVLIALANVFPGTARTVISTTRGR